jgi:branched-chain amino acid transport system ATP-binding protein
MSEQQLMVERVTKRFGGVVANDNITLSVPTGKTTLFNSIVGYHPIEEGSIRFEGQELTGMRVQAIARLGLLRTFQQTRIYGKMTCVENMQISVPHNNERVRTMFSEYAHEVTQKAESLLEFVGLYEKRYLMAGDLSFGHERLKRTNADLGITLFVIEHNMRAIMNLAEHIYCLAHGELLTSGPPEQIQKDQQVIDAYLGAK